MKIKLLFLLTLLNINIYALEIQTFNNPNYLTKFSIFIPSARFNALGNCGTALSEGAESIFINPANTITNYKNSFFISHNFWLADILYDTLGYVLKIDENSSYGISISFINYGNIETYDISNDEEAIPLETVTPLSLILKFNSSRKIDNLKFGFNINYIKEDLIKAINEIITFDLGSNFSIETLSLGLSFKNIGLDFNGYPIYKTLTLGIGYTITLKNIGNITTETNFIYILGNNVLISLGIEYTYNKIIAIRVGYQSDNSDAIGLTRIRTGIGIKYLLFNLDYAFEPFGDLGNSHKISAGFNF